VVIIAIVNFVFAALVKSVVTINSQVSAMTKWSFHLCLPVNRLATVSE